MKYQLGYWDIQNKNSMGCVIITPVILMIQFACASEIRRYCVFDSKNYFVMVEEEDLERVFTLLTNNIKNVPKKALFSIPLEFPASNFCIQL